MDVIEWLLEPDDPPVRYRTLAELMDGKETAEALEAKHAIPDSLPVRKLLNAMHPDGYWLQKNPRSGRITGDSTEYGSFGTTHFCLSYCAELGLDRDHPLVMKASLRYLGLQKDDGDWYGHFSCLYGYNIRTFVMLGFRDDDRVQNAADMMLATIRPDGGYLCDMHEKNKGTKSKSCIRGSVKALLAFSELPEYWGHERCRQLADYFLNRNGIYCSTGKEHYVNNDMKFNSFPVTWRANVWEVLYALSKMGYGMDRRLAGAWEVLDSRMDEFGRCRLDWTPAQCTWKAGKKGEPSKWITLYCMLAKKYRSSTARDPLISG